VLHSKGGSPAGICADLPRVSLLSASARPVGRSRLGQMGHEGAVLVRPASEKGVVAGLAVSAEHDDRSILIVD
jgi:hypothetical protein